MPLRANPPRSGCWLRRCLVLLLACAQRAACEPKLLVVSYDGFRYDYFRRNVTPFMSSLKHAGSHADYMTNVFITNTFPNHHSIATGLYAESHGVVDNECYDVRADKKFGYSWELYHYNKDVVPIWTLNEQNGKYSGAMMWPGASFEYQNTSLTFSEQFKPSQNWTTRIDKVISWLKDEYTPMNFGMLYIEEPDHHGHAIGISSPEFNEILRKLDQITQYLHDQLTANGLHDVNVIHLSDHGMTSVTYENIIDIRQYLNSTTYTMAGRALGLHIFPKADETELLFHRLKEVSERDETFDVYMKDDIPPRFNYKNNPRIGSIFVSAKPGYAFHPLKDNIPYYENRFHIKVTNKTEFGVHGYDNQLNEMRPFFFAYGPAFKKHCQIKPFKSVNIYPLICEILHLKCPPNNGTLDELKECLTFPVASNDRIKFDLLLTGSCIGVIVVAFLILLCQYKNTQSSKTKDRTNRVV